MSDILHAPVTLILLIVTIGVSVFAFNNNRLIDELLLDVGEIKRRGQVWRMLTAGLLHGDPTHLFFNMLTLYFFGAPLEQGIGAERFLILYFGSLLGGSALSLLENWRKPGYRALGASGAIAGITTCFSVLAPFAGINVFLLIPVPAILFTVGFIAYSWISMRDGRTVIGHSGHLGGALAGLVITCLLFQSEVRALPDKLAEGFQNFPSLF